jgi:predicted nucleotidyltransferase
MEIEKIKNFIYEILKTNNLNPDEIYIVGGFAKGVIDNKSQWSKLIPNHKSDIDILFIEKKFKNNILDPLYDKYFKAFGNSIEDKTGQGQYLASLGIKPKRIKLK